MKFLSTIYKYLFNYPSINTPAWRNFQICSKKMLILVAPSISLSFRNNSIPLQFHSFLEILLKSSFGRDLADFFFLQLKIFQDNIKTCLSQISSSPRRIYSKTFFACKIVLAAILHYPGNVQRLFRLQNCLSRKSSISRKYSKTFSPASSTPAASSNHPVTSSNQQYPSRTQQSSSKQQQAAAIIQ